MDSGGLASMTYNSHGYPATTGFGSAPSSYGNRKGAHIKRLSVAPPSGMNSIYEDEESNPVPRTARSQLLAGLRTAPKHGNSGSGSAPYNQQEFSIEPSYGRRNGARPALNVPQTATASSFNRVPSPTLYNPSAYQNMYSQQQVQATPDFHDQHEQMDPEMYNMLMQQNALLVQKQQQLQMQLQKMTAATQQMQGMNLNNGYQSPMTPITPGVNMFNQQYQNAMQSVIQPTAQPGLFSIYNPMTGQHSYFYDQNQSGLPVSPPLTTPGLESVSPVNADSQSRFSRKDTTSPSFGNGFGKARTTSPPKASSSPQPEVAPLPPPSANAYRPGQGHRRSMSNALATAAKDLNLNGPKTADFRSSFPRTPMTGGFGPGMARAGEHPIRQPRGPPPMDELLAAPTTAHEGSKNFASLKRRLAINNLVQAGKDRQTSVRNSSSDMGTPSSEAEINFIISDADSEGSSSATGSASLSGDATFGNAKYGAAIGSEWEALKKPAGIRTTTRPFSSSGIGGLDGSFGGIGTPRDFASAVKTEERASPALSERRSPLLVLTSAAEKRKSTLL